MNKLAVLAFTLLLLLSAMSWYLAKGSVNDYLRSQITLQGHYYSGQQTNVAQTNFIAEKNSAVFSKITLANVEGYAQEFALTVDEVTAKLVSPHDKSQPHQLKDGLRTSQIVTLSKLTLKTVTINIEQRTNNQGTNNKSTNNKNNITELIERVSLQLATDYPALYPKLAAKLYAEQNPDLNAEQYSEPNAKPNRKLNTEIAEQQPLIVSPAKEENKAVLASQADKLQKKLLGKAQTRIAIQEVKINKLIVRITNSEQVSNQINNQETTHEFNNIHLGAIGGINGLASNQIGGEVLRLLLQKGQTLRKVQHLNIQ